MKKKVLVLTVALTLPLFSNFMLAQAPDLGTASNFILFTSIGALGNTGSSHLTGKIGTNNGAITGFGNVDGTVHNSDAASSLCADDLLSAYNQLNSSVASFFPLSPLGNGQILNQGVYSISGNAVLNQQLILDAQGDSNAVFIFKIQGTFSTNVSSQIVLFNGARASNVFWKVEGAVSLSAGTAMKGTVVANNAAITIGSNVSLEGRTLSTNGAVNVTNIIARLPNGNGGAILTGPTAPALGSTACYALFSASGSMVNSGASIVSGDVGTNLGLTTGFIPVNVNGTIHLSPDASTAACAADLTTIQTYLNSLPNDIQLLSPLQFGNSLVLTPHTYLLNAATLLTDTLYLNALGNEDCIFVIKINGAFSTNSNARVVLINGAKSYNVFWYVNGAVSIGSNTNFKGTIICNNGAVNLAQGVVLDGRAFTTSGAFSTEAINTTMLDCHSTLHINLMLQGYYIGSHIMAPVLMNQGVGASSTVCDSILVQLRDRQYPYTVLVSSTVLLQTNGTAELNFATIYKPCYIAIIHRNCIQTWSKFPIGSDVSYYDFTISATQAYGNNMVEVENGVWAFYAGDVNEDENIDLIDITLIDHDENEFDYGYFATDINGDGNVDLIDNLISETNATQFIYSQYPQ